MQNRIGIWGFGIVGKSLLSFFRSEYYLENLNSLSSTQVHDFEINILDKRILSYEEQELIKKYKANFICSNERDAIEEFLQYNDEIVISAGIDASTYSNYLYKIKGEIDIFAKFFKKPSIAITGTLGKTTITKLLGDLASLLPLKIDYKSENNINQIPKNTQNIVVAGNIGKGLSSLIPIQSTVDYAILEFSSFQLDLNSIYSPDIALWTNLYPNHLDRHLTLEKYFEAKFKLLKNQNKNQISIISLELFNTHLMRNNLKDLKSQICIVSTRPFTKEEKNNAKYFRAVIFYFDCNNLFVEWACDSRAHKIISLKNISNITFLDNWVFILTTLFLIGKDLSFLEKFTLEDLITGENGKSLSLEPHRLEYCGRTGEVEFYNDSKATIMEATLAAIKKLSTRNLPIILFIGGVGKGVDRSEFLKKIKMMGNVTLVVAFGKEANSFEADIKAKSFEEAFELAKANFKPNSLVLFSPGGASFDLFENYEKRGELFKKVVREYEAAFSKSPS